MQLRRAWSLAVIVGAVCLLAFHSAAQCQDEWSLQTPFNGAPRTVGAIKVFDDGQHGSRLFCAGSILAAGTTFVSNGVTSFDGTAFSQVGSTSGFTAKGVASFRGELWVAGSGSMFTDPASMKGLARWDGRRWAPVPRSLEAPEIDHIDMISASDEGVVIVGEPAYISGRTDTVFHILHWDGVAWRLLFRQSVPVALTAGIFGHTIWNSTYWMPVTRWNGSNWVAVSPPNGSCYAVTMADHQGVAVASLTFEYTDGTPSSSGVYVWDGTAFRPLGVDRTYQAQRLKSAGGVLYDIRNSVINRYDPVTAQWVQVTPTGTSGVSDVEVFGGKLYVSGDFQRIGGISACNLASWNGSVWQPAVDGFNGAVQAILDDGDGTIVAGAFTRAPGVDAGCIARQQGGIWSPFTSGVRNVDGSAAFVSGAVRYRGDLVVAGKFNRAGDLPVSNVARWDGSRWWPMGTGFAQQADGLVASGDVLLAVGNYQGSQASLNAKSWNGSQWVTVQGWTAANPGSPVIGWRGSVFFGSRGVLWRWNGQSSVGTSTSLTGSTSSILGLAIYRDELLAFGRFDRIGGVAAQNIAAWNGVSWRQFAPGFAPLYAGGIGVQVGEDLVFSRGGWLGTEDVYAPVVFTAGHWRALPSQFSDVTTLANIDGQCVAGLTTYPSHAIASLHVASGLAVSDNGPDIQCSLGGTAVLSVAAVGNGPLHHQWRRDGISLYDSATPWGSVVAGSQSDTLTIAGFLLDDATVYDCIIRDDCGEIASRPLLPFICISDANNDGGIDGSDLEAFFELWQQGSTYADVNFDGGVDGPDIETFMTRWAAGLCT